MARVLLLLPSATYRAHDFVSAAAALGVEVVVASERRQALSALMGDRALSVPLSRPAEAVRRIVEAAARSPLTAVVAVDDQGVLVAAEASARLGLMHNPAAAVAATRDKAAMRRALAAAGVAQPAFRVAASDEEVGAATDELGAPVVVKPLSLSGSRGVIRADDCAAAIDAARWVRKIRGEGGGAGASADQPLLVERFVPGAEVAVEGLLRGGRLEVLAVFDKPDPLDGPYFEETIYVTPSRLPAERLEDVRRLTAAAAGALGLVEGPVHAELRVDAAGAAGASAPDAGREGDHATLIEVAARSIGGLCARTLRFGAGISLEQIILRHALGLPLDDLRRERAAVGVMMLPVPREGVLRAVDGQDAAKAVPLIAGLEVTIPLGRRVRPLPEGDRYLGFLFARGDAPAAVEEALRAAHACLAIRIE